MWIAGSFRDEHRAALDWLNEKANASARFFGIEIEAWRIGDSAPAPKFNIVSEPNESSDRAKQAVREGGLTELGQLRIKFWTAFTDYIKSAGASFQCEPVTSDRFLHVKLTLQGSTFAFEMYRDQYIDVYFGSWKEEQMEELRRICREHKQELERELGEKADCSEESDGFWIWVRREDDTSNVNNWLKQHQWMKDTMEKLLKVVGKHVQHGSTIGPEADQHS